MPYVTNKTGYMSGRELMQQIGTEVFRCMNPDVWVEAFLRSVDSKNNYTCCDCRFPNEVIIPKTWLADSVFVRLTADIFHDDHISETSLDKNVFDWSNFSMIIENDDMTIDQKNAAFMYGLSQLGYDINEESLLYLPYINEELMKKVTINK